MLLSTRKIIKTVSFSDEHLLLLFQRNINGNSEMLGFFVLLFLALVLIFNNFEHLIIRLICSFNKVAAENKSAIGICDNYKNAKQVY